MKVVRIIFMLSLMCTLCSCREDRTATIENDMLKTVPSDAVAVAAYRRAADMISTIVPENDVLHKLNLGKLSGHRATLSYCYTSALTYILAIDLGKNAADSLDRVLALTHQADSLGLKSIITRPDDGKWKALVLSASETLLSEVQRHVETGTSILDASGFEEALSLATDANVVILKNSAAIRWLPSDKKGPVRRSCATMIRSLADWTVLSGKGSRVDLAFSHPDIPSYYAQILASVSDRPLKILETAPDSCEFCFSIATGGDAFRNSYEHWLDAGMKLNKYRNALKQAEKSTGKHPLDWERELGVQEVSIVRRDGHCVILVRRSKPFKGCEFKENPYLGFVTLLYGRIFAHEDRFMCRKGIWTAFGSEEDVHEWAEMTKSDNKLKPCSFYLKDGHSVFYGDKTKYVLWNLNR